MPALAQDGQAEGPQAGRMDDIVVTARKREESILKVPVVATALSQEKLDILQIDGTEDLQKFVPGMNVAHGLLSVGTLVSIRGVGTNSLDSGVDQSVSLNIDGLSMGNGLAFNSGLFDLQQIEVFKGPQALFYGKSSPGGVIALRTADPTDRFEVVARAGYEFEAREAHGELIVSGPLSDTLKARLAGMYSKSDGYFRNLAVATPGAGGLTPKDRREPGSEGYVLRGTVLWNPSSDFSARLKVNLVRDRVIDSATYQLASCPDGPGSAPAGIPFIGGDDCKLDRNLRVVFMDPQVFKGIPNGGVPYLLANQRFGTLELNYDLSSDLALTSTTAYYNLKSSSLVNSHFSTAAGPSLAGANHFRRRETQQELRLNSDFSGPINFTLGGFYQDGLLSNRLTVYANTVYPFLPPLLGDGQTRVDIKTYSLFGQLRWQIVPQLELAGGARWTDETRKETVPNYLTGTLVPVANPRIHSSNVAPEITLTYTPTDDLTLFAAYKKGFKSGSFEVAVPPNPGDDNSFDDERVKGGEIGLKSRLFDRQLNLNLAAYDYRYSGLQVGAVEPSSTGIPDVRIVNAGSARTYGIDFDATYYPASIEGLTLNGSVNWNHSRYKNLDSVPCWVGQTIADGCDGGIPTAAGLNTAQDASGLPFVRAPRWQATFGVSYEMPVGSDMKLVLSNSNEYSGKYIRSLDVNYPGDVTTQKSYLKADVSVALRGPENRWEIALIGNNITDKLVAPLCSSSNAANGLIFGGDITGGPTRGPAGVGEYACFTNRGRSIWARLTFRPFGG
jgi:iron complex outermembrane receptor protein